jgi:hypothetical protein
MSVQSSILFDLNGAPAGLIWFRAFSNLRPAFTLIDFRQGVPGPPNSQPRPRAPLDSFSRWRLPLNLHLESQMIKPKRTAAEQVEDEADRKALNPVLSRQTIAESQAEPESSGKPQTPQGRQACARS